LLAGDHDGVETPFEGTATKGGVMAGKFVLKKSANGQFHFSLHAGNGEIIATSEMYKSKEAAKNGIESVKANPATAAVGDQT
jgi:uncharacterized protein YegP (UPF0339 family)